MFKKTPKPIEKNYRIRAHDHGFYVRGGVCVEARVGKDWVLVGNYDFNDPELEDKVAGSVAKAEDRSITLGAMMQV